MQRNYFSILFFIRRTRLLKNGEAPIGLRITVNGQRAEIQIKRSIPEERWNASKGCAVQIQLRSATSQCVLHEKTTAGLPQRQGCIAPESVESISNTIKKETEVSLGLTIFVLL